MEPIAIRPHQAMVHRPEYHAMQAIVMCNEHFNYGLSVVWARPEGGEYTGLYMNGVNTYEVALIQWEYEGEVRPFEFTLFPHETYVIGYLSIEEVDQLCSAIMLEGLEGYMSFQRTGVK